MNGTLKHIPSTLLLSVLLALGSVAGQGDPSSEVSEKLRIGGSQHAIIQILIEERQFDEVEQEFDAILALGLSGEHEILLAQSAWKTVEKLRLAGQFDLAHRIITNTLEMVGRVDNRYTLLMLRAKTYQEEQRIEEALETLREAKSLGVGQ